MSQKMRVVIYGFKNRITQQDCTALLWENFPKCFIPASPHCPIKGPSVNPSSRSENASFPDLTEEPTCSKGEASGREEEEEVEGIGPERIRLTE